MMTVTQTDIAAALNVARPTVANWARRHADYPAPIADVSTPGRPRWSWAEVEAWAADRGYLVGGAPFPPAPFNPRPRKVRSAVAAQVTLPGDVMAKVDAIRSGTGETRSAALRRIVTAALESC